MPRSTEASNHGIPNPPDVEAWRHFGDGFAGRIVAARLQAYSTVDGDYRDLVIDSGGILQTAGSGGGGGVVTQGTSPWVVSAASLPLPTGAAKDSTLTDGTQRVGGTVAVSLATAPSTPVTGTFWQSTQPVSNAGTFAVQAAATLAAETTKVIGTVNQGTSPWVVSGAVTGVDTTLGATVTPKAASVWDVSDRSGRALGSIANTSFNVGNFPATQPVSVASMPSTPVTAASLPLPAGAALELGGQLQQVSELLQQLVIENRIHSLQFQQGLNVADDPAALRSDPAYLN